MQKTKNPKREAEDAKNELKIVIDIAARKGVSIYESDGTPRSTYLIIRELCWKQYAKGYDSAMELWNVCDRARHHGKDKIHK